MEKGLRLYQRIGVRRSPRQGMRPHLRCDCRRFPDRGPAVPRRRRDDVHDQPHRVRRRGARAGHDEQRALRGSCARTRFATSATSRTASTGSDAEIDSLIHCAVGRHRPGRRCLGQQGRRRRRPGHHVRLRLPRDRRSDAGADLLRARHPALAGRRAALRRRARPRARTPRARSRCAMSMASRSARPPIVVSTQHADRLSVDDVREIVRPARRQRPAGRLDVRRARTSTSTRPVAS